MLEIKRFINELMSSNCFILYDTKFNDCIVIDPGSKDSLNELEFFTFNKIVPSYIILTHEHTDHTWGVNGILEKYPNCKVVCCEVCKLNLNKESNSYFSYYYSDNNYTYSVNRVDILLEDINYKMKWHDQEIIFLSTPGHSMGSICIMIDNIIFTGDTLMQFKPYINKRNGSKKSYEESLAYLGRVLNCKIMMVYPGHGDVFYKKFNIQ